MKKLLLVAIIQFSIAAIGFTQESKIRSLGDGYVRLSTDTYRIDLPEGWKVSPESWYGQRKASPKSGSGELAMMTAPPSQQSWDEVYRTSIFYITREGRGKASPYKLTKTKTGLEAATFEVSNEEGYINRRYVLIKHETKGLLALSVTIPDRDSEKQWVKHFKRMVDSAVFTGN